VGSGSQGERLQHAQHVLLLLLLTLLAFLCPPPPSPRASVELIKEVLYEMKHPDTSEAHIAFLHKVFKREKLILRYLPSGGKYRRSCFIYTRPFRKDENEPLTVHTTRDPFASHHADMMMTRSLGDWRHVAWILPRPQVQRAVVAAGVHHRVVIASDGLWDVVSHQQCAEIVRAAETAQAASDGLLAAANKVYLEDRQLELPGDDTTVLVIDLNPSELEWTAPSSPSPEGEGAVCCGLM